MKVDQNMVAAFQAVMEGMMSRPGGRPPMRDFYIPREPVVAERGDVSMTRQEFAAECDVNVLLAKYEKTGIWPMPMAGQEPRYLDCSDVPDLASAMAFMKEAEAAFMSLPARARLAFENDPVQFVEFAENPANIGQMREWGLAPPLPDNRPLAGDPVPTGPAVRPAQSAPSPAASSGGSTVSS